jgi:eukaryotic-like serine/threonine-protein kinase
MAEAAMPRLLRQPSRTHYVRAAAVAALRVSAGNRVSMTPFKRLIAEVHRRSLWQVLSIYLVGSWIGYQVIVTLTQGIGLPPWVPGFAVVLFIVGLPIVLATAFVQEGLPGGKDARRARRRARRAPAASPGRAASSASPGGPHHWLFTWQRAVLGGIVAFLLLGLTAGGYMGMRNAGIGPFGSLVASGKLEGGDRIVIADFESGDADGELAAAAAQALRVDLAQSPLVSIVEPRYVRDVLERMGRSPTAVVDAQLAREIAVRDGAKAIVSGEVRRAGRGYVLSAELVAATDGASLASFRENAADSTAVLGAVDRLSRRLRERIGESLRTVHGGLPLEAVTTPSLEALRKYSQAVHAMDVELDYAVAIALLNEAIAIDSAFGMAWRKLAVAYNNTQAGRSRVTEAATRAYRHRDRMTQRERDHATAYYHMHATRDTRAAVAAYRAVLQAYADDRVALHNIALLYSTLREFELAAEHYERAIAGDSMSAISYSNLVDVYVMLDRVADAERLLDLAVAKLGESRGTLITRLHLEAGRGNYAAAEALALRLRDLRAGDPVNRSAAAYQLADLATLRGQLREAERHRAAALVADLERGAPWQQLMVQVWQAEDDVFLRRDPRRAVRRLEDANAAYPLASFPVLNRPYLDMARTYGFAGDARRARELLAEYDREMPPDMRGDDRAGLAAARAAIAYADGDFAEASRHLRLAEDIDICQRCVNFALAVVFDRAEQPDSAFARYQRYLAMPAARALWIDNIALAHVHERLAELLFERGDTEGAALHAARFVDLWREADPELQPRVREKQQFLQRLRAG